MATIKTTGTGSGLRVLTKTASGVQRVSCSCCEEAVCCPYPADQLGVGYTEDDLPDTIDVEGLILGVPERIIVSRSGSFYGPINQSIFGGGAFSEFIFVTTGVEGIRWFRNTTNGEPIGNGEPCLFQTLEEGAAILDTFADSYTVNTYDEFVGGSPVSTFTISRESLCVWSGFDERYGVTGKIVTLDYNTPNGSLTRASMWTMEGFGRVDGGPYNSPVGIYADGNYVWEVVE